MALVPVVAIDIHLSQTRSGTSPRAIVLVEGVSDQLALDALARRGGRNLSAEGVSIVPMGGATNIRSFLNRYGPKGLDVRLAGLCDAGEEDDFRRGLEGEGLGSNLTRDDMERLGFYVCVADLEDELIRSLGVAAVERSSKRKVNSKRSEPSSESLNGGHGAPRRSSGASSARTAAGRSNPPRYSSRPWT